MWAERVLPVCLLAFVAVIGSEPSRAASPTPAESQQHAFDFHFGTWRTHILRRTVTASGATGPRPRANPGVSHDRGEGYEK